jgi:hypothetical protein
MNADQFIASIMIDDVKKQLDNIGFSGYSVSTAGKARVIRPGQMEAPPLSLSLQQPKTVSELHIFSRALYQKPLGTDRERVYVLAASPSATPIATVHDELATDILANMERVIEAVKILTGKPTLDSPVLATRSFMEVIEHAKLQRMLDDLYRGIIHINKGGRPARVNYNRGFELLATGVCSSDQEAYKRVIEEMGESPEKNILLTNLDEYLEGLEKFKSAMTYRRRKFR